MTTLWMLTVGARDQGVRGISPAGPAAGGAVECTTGGAVDAGNLSI